MECTQARDHLSAYLDGELSAELAAAVRDHLAACPACRRTVEELQATVDLVGRLPVHPAPATLAADVMREVEHRLLAPESVSEAAPPERTLAVHRPPLWPRVLAVAACVALAAGIGTLAFLGTLHEGYPARVGDGTHLASIEGTEHTLERIEKADRLPAGGAPVHAQRGLVNGGGLAGEDATRGERPAAPATYDDDLLSLHIASDGLKANHLDAYGALAMEDTDVAKESLAGATRFRLNGRAEHGHDKRIALASTGNGRRGGRHAFYFNGDAVQGRTLGDLASNGTPRPAGAAWDWKRTDGADEAYGTLTPESRAAEARLAEADAYLREVESLRSQIAAQPAKPDGPAVGAADTLADAGTTITVPKPQPAPGTASPYAAFEAKGSAHKAEKPPAPPPESFAMGLGEPANLGKAVPAKAAPAKAGERSKTVDAVETGVRRQPLDEAAEARAVQLTMNTVAVGHAPVEMLDRVATPSNLDLASNQLVVEAPSRAAANLELVRLFSRNDWTPVAETREREAEEAVRRKKAAMNAPPPADRNGRQGPPAGLYYLAHRNGEDTWVVLTSPDDLSRFATQVAQSRTIEVASDSSGPFQAVRRLQQQLAMLANRSGRTAGTAGGALGKGGAGGGAAEGASRRSAFGAASARKDMTEEAAATAASRSDAEAREDPAAAAWEEPAAPPAPAQVQIDVPASDYAPVATQAGPTPEEDETRAGDEMGAEAEPSTEAEPPPPAWQVAKVRGQMPAKAKSAGEKLGEQEAGRPKQPAEGESQDAAYARQRIEVLDRVPPNQVMLVVRVRGPDRPHASIEARQAEQPPAADTAPEAAQQRVQPAAEQK